MGSALGVEVGCKSGRVWGGHGHVSTVAGGRCVTRRLAGGGGMGGGLRGGGCKSGRAWGNHISTTTGGRLVEGDRCWNSWGREEAGQLFTVDKGLLRAVFYTRHVWLLCRGTLI